MGGALPDAVRGGGPITLGLPYSSTPEFPPIPIPPSAWGGGGAAPRGALGNLPRPGAMGAAAPGRGCMGELRGGIFEESLGVTEGSAAVVRCPYSSVSDDDVMDVDMWPAMGGCPWGAAGAAPAGGGWMDGDWGADAAPICGGSCDGTAGCWAGETIGRWLVFRLVGRRMPLILRLKWGGVWAGAPGVVAPGW